MRGCCTDLALVSSGDSINRVDWSDRLMYSIRIRSLISGVDWWVGFVKEAQITLVN